MRVVGRCRQSQQSEGILDFAALVEADIADQRVGNTRPHQRLLETARKCITAVEDRRIIPREPLCVAAGDFGDDATGLGLRIAKADDLDRVAA